MSLPEGFRETRRGRSILGSGQAVLVTYVDAEGNEWAGDTFGPRAMVRTIAQIDRSRQVRQLGRDLREIHDNPEQYGLS